MQKINFENSPSAKTPINATNLNQMQTNIENEINGSDWTTLELESAFKCYSNNTNYAPKYKKTGNIVSVRGIVSPTAAISSELSDKIIFTLPTGLRPSGMPRYFVCHGSGSNKWLLTVNANGNVTFSRYGTSTYVEAPAGCWLPFDITFTI